MKVESTLGRALAGTGAYVDFSGNWKNDLTSTMTINQQNGTLSGVYTSAVSGSHTTTKGDIAGFADGDLIAFLVHWRDFQAITSWVGQLDANDTDKINTLWQMTKQVAHGDEWASINAGFNVFTRLP